MGLDIEESLQEQASTQELSVCEVWPEHWQALSLFLACQRQIEITLGGMGGVHHMAARSVNVAQEVLWLSLPKKSRVATVALYREIEAHALNAMNQRANQKT